MTRKNLRRLHRWLGAAGAVFVIFMTLSGLVINHSSDLGLDRSQVREPFLLDWYGLDGPEHVRSFKAGANWMSFAGSQLYLNGEHVAMLTKGIAAVSINDMLIAAGSHELLLLDFKGNLVERVPWDTPDKGSIDSIGLLASGVIALKSGNHVWVADEALLNWSQSVRTATIPTWATPGITPDAIRDSIAHQYRAFDLSLEKVLLDLHSGRFFGFAGTLVYDLLALTICFVAISGLVLWFRGRRNIKRAGNHQTRGT